MFKISYWQKYQTALIELNINAFPKKMQQIKDHKGVLHGQKFVETWPW